MLRFLKRSLPLVLVGIALGLLARFVLGVPESENTNTRKFQRPVDERLRAEQAHEQFDIPLDKDLEIE